MLTEIKSALEYGWSPHKQTPEEQQKALAENAIYLISSLKYTETELALSVITSVLTSYLGMRNFDTKEGTNIINLFHKKLLESWKLSRKMMTEQQAIKDELEND